jgi:YegS C-terminal NAD kinase beta sandwich-like domain
MPISKGSPYGEPGTLPDDGVVVRSDAEARAVLERARAEGRPFPPLGLLGGDLCRTLGGPGDEARLRSPDAVRFPVDLGEVLLDGRLHLFVAHVVVRTRGWGHVVAAMNAQFFGPWVLGPRAHPNDGLLDIYRAHLSLADRLKVRARVRHGAHMPHPRINERRAAAMQIELDHPRPVYLDGEQVGEARDLALRIEPDALTVVV